MMAVANGSTTACYPPMASSSNGAWQGDNPLDYALPLAILQICLVVVVTRSLGFMLRPLRQPRVVAEILGGILLGPSALGRSQTFLDNVFPDRSLTVLDTLADIGLVFFLFLVGLELDLRALRRTGKGALLIALAGISLPIVLGVGTCAVLRATIAKEAPQASFLVFIGVALSITAFPVLARILAELKLLSTDVGRMALSAAAVNDIAAWILLALAIALSGSGSPLISLWVLLSGFAFVAAVAVFVRPMLGWMAGRTIQGEPIKEQYVCATLALVLAAGFATDAIGIHALFGAFVVGVMVPKEGHFAGVLIDKLEDFVCSLFLPLYFVSSGLKTNVATIRGGESWALLLLVIATACLGKIGGTVIASLIAGVPRPEAMTLGFLMNTKGLVELIVLNIGKDRKVLNDETFAILVLMAIFNTFITTPVVMAIYKPARRAEPYKRHTIEHRNGADSELRILACFHNSRSIPTLINLVESSRGAQQQGITVYAMHLMERSERPSAIYMVNKARHNGLPFCYSTASSTSGDHVVVYFETYKRLSHVTLRPMTAISDLQTIHKDIIESAEHKRAALIVLPFHKVMQIDGSLESLGQTYRRVNQRVLDQATCSVAILLDRGFGGAAQVSARDVSYTIAVLFFGGPDDREALAYGARMAEHPGIALYVVHFVTLARRTGDSVGVTINNDKHHVAEETAISEFRTKVVASNRSITLQEREVETSADIVAVIKGMARCNLFLVGRCSPAMALMDTASADPELGPVGCYLASPGFSTTASVLIIQQYNPKANPAQLKTDDIEAHNKPTSNGTTATASTSVVLS